MTFEEYLSSKRIDSNLFFLKEKKLWASWKKEFEQIHPNSFTAQKLYLINPIRRKYPLKEIPIPKTAAVKQEAETKPPTIPAPSTTAKPVMKPVFKPKPKIN